MITNRQGASSCSCILVRMLFVAALLSLGHTAYIVQDKFRARDIGDCNTDLQISEICYHCGETNPSVFQLVHDNCCRNEKSYREFCIAWFTEEPKRGRRNGGWLR